ncbi:MAG: hypothetical protein HYX34_08680 [Actinobacteria bacterium]|nr:hypothetical protein [Actinomycetota bacterium]
MLHLTLHRDDDGVRVTGRIDRTDAPSELDQIASGLLELLADRADYARTDGGCEFSLLRRPRG